MHFSENILGYFPLHIYIIKNIVYILQHIELCFGGYFDDAYHLNKIEHTKPQI